MTTQNVQEAIETLESHHNGMCSATGECADYDAAFAAIRQACELLEPADLEAGRILRGHTKIGCHCRYCKNSLSGRIVLK